MPGGRPLRFTEELRGKYLTLLSAGVGRRESARRVGMSPRQVAAHRQADEEFRADCEEAEASANEPVVHALYEAASRGEPWAVKLWLTNRDSGNWRERVEVDQKVSGTVNLEAPGIADVLALGQVLEARRLELGAGNAEVSEPGVLDADSWEAEAPNAEVGPEAAEDGGKP